MHIYNEWGRKYRRGKVEIIETMIDGNKFLKGPSLPGKGLQTQNESLTLDRGEISLSPRKGEEEKTDACGCR